MKHVLLKLILIIISFWGWTECLNCNTVSPYAAPLVASFLGTPLIKLVARSTWELVTKWHDRWGLYACQSISFKLHALWHWQWDCKRLIANYVHIISELFIQIEIYNLYLVIYDLCVRRVTSKNQRSTMFPDLSNHITCLMLCSSIAETTYWTEHLGFCYMWSYRPARLQYNTLVNTIEWST